MNSKQQTIYDLFYIEKLNKEDIGKHLGISRHAVRRALKKIDAWTGADSEIAEAAKAGGVEDPRSLSHFWKIVKDKDGNGYSLFVKNPETHEEMSFRNMILESIADTKEDGLIPYEPRSHSSEGEHLLVVDLADVHFGKLCVETETGYTYSREVARHRVVEGTKALLKKAAPFGIHRILYVMGNDVVHTDDGKATTNGTPQDTEGSFFQVYSDAKAANIEAIKECEKVAPVDLIHVMSNHDWRTGWCLSQDIASRFEEWPTINSTVYNMSESSRKYYGFGNNALQFEHGNDVKEEKLYGLFVSEARHLLSKCQHLYSYRHHFHHKDRKRRGVDVFLSEKDHQGITEIVTGSNRSSGTHLNIEYVRSPSAPDGWHDRHGYINRQGVECFLHHPEHGQTARFTEWF